AAAVAPAEPAAVAEFSQTKAWVSTARGTAASASTAHKTRFNGIASPVSATTNPSSSGVLATSSGRQAAARAAATSASRTSGAAARGGGGGGGGGGARRGGGGGGPRRTVLNRERGPGVGRGAEDPADGQVHPGQEREAGPQ